jgi:hypothetical protein
MKVNVDNGSNNQTTFGKLALSDVFCLAAYHVAALTPSNMYMKVKADPREPSETDVGCAVNLHTYSISYFNNNDRVVSLKSEMNVKVF